MNAGGLFRGSDAKLITDLSREEFARELAAIGKPAEPNLFR